MLWNLTFARLVIRRFNVQSRNEELYDKELDFTFHFYENGRTFSVITNPPDDSIYSGGIFQIDVRLHLAGLTSPPTLKFVSPIYHPNVNSSGMVDPDYFRQIWSLYTGRRFFSRIIRSIKHIFKYPHLGDQINNEIQNLFMNDAEKFEQNARQLTHQNNI